MYLVQHSDDDSQKLTVLDMTLDRVCHTENSTRAKTRAK